MTWPGGTIGHPASHLVSYVRGQAVSNAEALDSATTCSCCHIPCLFDGV